MDAALALRRDVRVISLVGGAHGLSHFLQLALPPLFPLIRAEYGYSYTELGLLVTVFFIGSGVFQTGAGFIVDRYGARTVLLGGLALLSLSTVLYGVFPSYPALMALSFFAGLGNSVFHPADFSILSASVADQRMGRAFSVHSATGFIGYGVAPLGMVLLAQALGWREAVILVGMVGIVYLVILIAFAGDLRDDSNTEAKSAADAPAASAARLLFSVPIVMLFVFFTLLAMGQIAVQTFSQQALIEMYGASITAANGAVTGFLCGTLAGVLVGGWLADRTGRLNAIVMAFMLTTGAFMMVAGLYDMVTPQRIALYVVAGAALGAVFPSRDMLVRQIAPPGASGRIFGFVYSGLDTGAAIIPLIAGWLMDSGRASAVFVIIGLCFAACLPALAVTGRGSADKPGATP